MIKRNNRNILTRLLFNQKVLALLGLVIIVLISIPLAKNISQRYKIDQEIKQLENEIAELENKNTHLEKFIDYLESNQFVEEQARLQLGLKKKGEEVAVVKNKIIDEHPSISSPRSEIGAKAEHKDDENIFNISSSIESGSDKPDNNPQKWWKYFFE